MGQSADGPVVVLLVGDDRDRLARTAAHPDRARESWTVETASSAAAALDRLEERPPVDCVVSEQALSDRTGLQLVETVREDRPDLPFVLFPVAGSAALATEALDAGVTDYLHQGDSTDQYAVLVDRVGRAVAARNATDGDVDEWDSPRESDRNGGSGDRERELERYETIVQLAGDGAYVVDPEGRYVLVNDRFVERTGYARDEILGRSADSLVGDGDVERVERLIADLLGDESRDYAEIEVTVETADGDEYPADVRMAPLVVDGEFRGTVGLTRDVTERKERERKLRDRTEALEERRRELRRQNDRLEGFVDVVSHDLRNPLNVATARLELAREECDSGHLEPVARAHDRMEQLIEDLLALALEGGHVEEPEPMALSTVARGAWATVRTESARLDVETDRTIRGDERRVRQALENLFRNSLEHGGPAVTVTVGDCDGGFSVADDGPGIAPNERERVFEPGYSTADDGTGLGLLIVSEIAEAHDWDAAVAESDSGGARFEFTGVDVVTDED